MVPVPTKQEHWQEIRDIQIERDVRDRRTGGCKVSAYQWG